MNCPDSTRLNDYADGALAAGKARTLEAHAAGCPACRAEVDALRRLRAAAAHLDREIAPARDLWPAIRLEVERVAPNAPGSSARRSASRNVVQLFAPVAFAAAIAFLMVVAGRNAPVAPRAGNGGWSVAALQGAPRIGARSVAGEGKLRVGEWLETDAASRAKVEVAQIGQVNLEPNSRLRLVGTSATDHRVELARGELSAFIYAPPRIFFVDTPSATAVDMGCFYTLSVQDDGSGELHVTAGYVALESGAREAIVPAGWKCRTRQGAGPGTPFAADASEELRAALNRFDFERASSPGALRDVLARAGASDAVTLWHLLSRVPDARRGEVFDALAKLHAPPASVTREGIVAGEAAMRNAWGVELGLYILAAR